MTRQEASEYALRWADAWNRRDLEAVLAHFEDDAVFTSPQALAVVGTATLRGKPALRDYWIAALGRIGSLRFSVDRVIWDPRTAELAIVYDREVDGRSKRVVEILRFGSAGRVVQGEVAHGATP